MITIIEVAESPSQTLWLYYFSNGSYGLWGEGGDVEPFESWGNIPPQGTFIDLMTDIETTRPMNNKELQMLETKGYQVR